MKKEDLYKNYVWLCSDLKELNAEHCHDDDKTLNIMASTYSESQIWTFFVVFGLFGIRVNFINADNMHINCQEEIARKYHSVTFRSEMDTSWTP
jgi:hypothetical protein